MIPGWSRIVAMPVVALRAACVLLAAALTASQSATAQIPSSELPGRARERFEEPTVPRATPGGPTISLPSTVAPQGAERIRLKLSRVVVTGSTVYKPADFNSLYADLLGRQVTLAEVYAIAQRITTKYGND